jgi:hypothetical protein
MKQDEMADQTEPVTRDPVPPPMPTTCPGCACDWSYRREAERQALMLLERNPNANSVASEFPAVAADLAQSDSEPARDFAATLRYAATLAANRVLRAEVRRLGGDPDRIVGAQP